MYIVEMTLMNRVVKTMAKVEDYDAAYSRFRSLRKEACREVRMLKEVDGVRTILKYIIRVRQSSYSPSAGE